MIGVVYAGGTKGKYAEQPRPSPQPPLLSTFKPAATNMSVPDNSTTLDISGKYTMNKRLSDSTEEILKLQGVGWLTRRAISLGTLTLYVKHHKDDKGVEHIDIDQFLTGGIPGTREERILDWQERDHNDHIFGDVIGKSRRIQIDDINEAFLKEGWTEDTKRDLAIESYVVSDTAKSGKQWIARQIWGFQDVNGERRYTRRIHFIGPKGEKVQARLVYDFLGAPLGGGRYES